MRNYKILSLDGGGSWALLQSMALKEIYKDTPVGTRCGDILKEFDLIVANSGGSLMLAAMIENYEKDIDVVTEMFTKSEIRNSVFSPMTFMEKLGLELLASAFKFGPKYKASRKYTALKNILKNSAAYPMREMEDKLNLKLPANIVICGYDYDRHRAFFFRTNQKSVSQGNPKFYDYTLADAVHAASNAPVIYFDEPAKIKIGDAVHQLWDGAVGGNNNPVLIGITEALAVFQDAERSGDSLSVLSIGTGNNMMPVKEFSAIKDTQNPALFQEVREATFASSIKNMATSITSEPPDAANYMAHMFLGGKAASGSTPAFVRMNPLLQPVLSEDGKRWEFPAGINRDDYNTYVELINLDMDATEQEQVEHIKTLGQWWIEDKVPNQPIRLDSSKMACDIGHPGFSQAKQDWLKRCGL